MINMNKFHGCLKEEGVNFITGVPDSLLNGFCEYVERELSKEEHVIAANEGNAIGLAAGCHISTGSVPLVYMQNSGIGNALNPLLSLTNIEVYSIPMILLIGWRGDPDVDDWVHHQKQGELTPELLELLDIPYQILDKDNNVYSNAKWAVETAKEINSPVALIAKKGVFSAKKKQKQYANDKMSRENAIEYIIDAVPDDTFFVATTGRATRELYDLREIRNEEHKYDFLNVGAMGHASSIANGIALSKKNSLVVCLDGDASAIMHLGSLTTSGVLNQSNFLHVILNNGAHESVGGQEAASKIIDFSIIAEKSGYNTVGKQVKNKKELQEAVNNLDKKEGPSFIDISIKKGIRDDLKPNLQDVSLKAMKNNLMIELNKK